MGDGNSTVGGQSYDALFAELEARGVDVVHLGIFDIDCVLRERRFGLAQARRFLENDPTFVNVLHKWDIADSVTADGPFVGEPIAVDTDSVRSYPFEGNSALLLADYAGPSRGMSARELLRGQIEMRAPGALRSRRPSSSSSSCWPRRRKPSGGKISTISICSHPTTNAGRA